MRHTSSLQPLRLLAAALALLIVSLAAPPATAQQQCEATSTLRGKFCNSPINGYQNQGNCIAHYNWCLANIDRHMHQWCVQIDQPNCTANDDCPENSSCNVHPVNQRNRTNQRCQQRGPNNTWHFEIFDVADCQCNCTDGPFPVPDEEPGPEDPTITALCESGAVDCSTCTEVDESTQTCADEPAPREGSGEEPTDDGSDAEPPAEEEAGSGEPAGGDENEAGSGDEEGEGEGSGDDEESDEDDGGGCGGCATTAGNPLAAGFTALLLLVFARRRRTSPHG